MAETTTPPDDLFAETAIVNAYCRLLFLRTRRGPGMWQTEDVQRLDELRLTVRNLFAGIAQIERAASGADEHEEQAQAGTPQQRAIAAMRVDPVTLNRVPSGPQTEDGGDGAANIEALERALGGTQQPQA